MLGIKWFTPYKQEEMFQPSILMNKFIVGLGILLTVILFIIINIITASKVAETYLLLAIVVTAFVVADTARHKKTAWSTTNLVGQEKSVWKLIQYGFIIGFVTIIIMSLATIALGAQPYQVFQLPGMQIQEIVNITQIAFSLFFTAGVVVIIEELYFNMYLLPTLATQIGGLGALTITAVFFFFFHFLTLGTGLTVLLQLFIFRFLSGYFVLRYRAALPGIIGHSILNALVALGV